MCQYGKLLTDGVRFRWQTANKGQQLFARISGKCVNGNFYAVDELDGTHFSQYTESVTEIHLDNEIIVVERFMKYEVTQALQKLLTEVADGWYDEDAELLRRLVNSKYRDQLADTMRQAGFKVEPIEV